MDHCHSLFNILTGEGTGTKFSYYAKKDGANVSWHIGISLNIAKDQLGSNPICLLKTLES